MGYLVGRNGIRPDPQNVKKIKNAEVPKNITKLRKFLGMAQYYWQYINGYADIIGPLYDMLKKDRPAIWRQAQQEAFNIIKNKLATESIRAYSDFNKPFKLYTDISDIGLDSISLRRWERKGENYSLQGQKIKCTWTKLPNNRKRVFSYSLSNPKI